jgi:hypothetical protein
MGWKDTIKPVSAAPSWRDSIKPVEASPDEVPAAASASAGFLSGLPGAKQIGAAGKTAMDVITGRTDLGDSLDEYRRERDSLSGDMNAKMAANPKSAMVGGLASAPFIPMPSGVSGAALYGGAHALGDSKADLTKGEFGQAIGDVGTGASTGALVGSVADLAGQVLTPAASKVGQYLRNKAEALKVKATGATGKQAAALAPGTGRYLLDNKIGGAFSSPAGIADAAEQSMDRSGAEIGNMLESKLSGTKVKRFDVLSAIDERLAGMANDESQDALAESLRKIRDGILAKAEKNPEIPIAEAEAIKRGFQKNVNYKTAAPNVNENDANAAAAYEYRQAVENAAGDKDPELLKKFLADKKNTAILSPVEEAARKRALQLQQSPYGGLLDIAAGGSGGAIGAALGGPVGMAVGGATGLGLKALRPRYASMGAHSSDALAKLVSSAPEKLGKYSDMLTQAATRGATSLMTKDAMLRSKDPEYAATVDKALGLDDIPESAGPQAVLIKNPLTGKVKVIPIELKDKALAAGGVLVNQ